MMPEPIQVKVRLLLPKPPNFLRIDGLDHTKAESAYDVKHLTEQQIREIGAQWTAQLIEHARKRKEANDA
jgi:hypothetical protein